MQRESLKSFIILLETEIQENENVETPKGDIIPLEYILYYGVDKSQNGAILHFINILNEFKETSEYQVLDKKYKNEINNIINEWSNFSSNDINSPKIYVSKLKDIKRVFVDYL